MMTAHRFALMLATLAALAQPAWCQEVGTVAAVEGAAEIGRNGTFAAANLGVPVSQGDELRTGQPGRLRVVFQDDSVISLSDDSTVTIDQQIFNAAAGTSHSLMQLLKGKVNALVSEYYHRSGAAYEIKTKTAVAGVRGTEFAMTYNPQDEVTEVVGITGVVQVHSAADPTGPGVLLTADEATSVAPGQLPTSPHRLEDSIFRQQLQGIEFIGAGRPESLANNHPLVAGTGVPPPDRAGAVAPATDTAANLGQKHDASSLVGDSPDVVKKMTGQLGIPLGK
ncbi:MAG TPA: FecR family protein [Candidatus Acidoferrales bacterium]|nr:FecR family protein [Candidatus Acidoferrales bacterium]